MARSFNSSSCFCIDSYVGIVDEGVEEEVDCEPDVLAIIVFNIFEASWMICRKSSCFSPSAAAEVLAVGEVVGDGSAAGWGDVGFCCSSVALITLLVGVNVVGGCAASAFGLDCRAEAPFSLTGQSFFTWAWLEQTKQRPAFGTCPHSCTN